MSFRDVIRKLCYFVLAHCALQRNATFRLDSFRRQIHSAPLYVLKTSLLYTRCLRAVNVTCIKSNVGLLQTAHYWAIAGVGLGRRVAFETIKLIHAKVLCVVCMYVFYLAESIKVRAYISLLNL